MRSLESLIKTYKYIRLPLLKQITIVFHSSSKEGVLVRKPFKIQFGSQGIGDLASFPLN